MSLGIKCFNCSGDTILRSCRPLIRSYDHADPGLAGRHTGKQHGVYLAAMTLHLLEVFCVPLSISLSIYQLHIHLSFIHVHTFSRPMKYSLLYHSCFDTSAVRSPQVWPQNKQNNFQSIHLMLKIFYLHIYTSNHKYYPCSRSLMHAYHLFLPLYK